jgi:hypothetical protein
MGWLNTGYYGLVVLPMVTLTALIKANEQVNSLITGILS